MFIKKISECRWCKEEYLQTHTKDVLCKSKVCKEANRKDNKKKYDDIKKRTPVILDNCNDAVRFKNIFILGCFNTCNAG